MKNEEKIRMVIATLSNNALKKGEQGITAQDISEVLGIKRNAISHYLNRMVEEGIVIKTKTRPVYFLYKEALDQFKNEKSEIEEDIFSKLIGADGSLSNVVKECKSATLYPGNGLPILLTGSSGVGKSFMAKLIYEYAKEKGIINEDSKFITFNCAEYSNNKELLSSKLFGYVKGAFTGADKDSKGVIDEAENGYLFLDEIHRLPPEGQEKLFLLLDKGVFERMGESGNAISAHIRLICATTENLNDFLIDTFIRRIPIITNLPNINDRPIDERIELIYRFYKEESNILKKDILVSNDVMNALLFMNKVGNVGALKNSIRYSCASSFRKNAYSEIIIKLEDLPVSAINTEKLRSVYADTYLHIKYGEKLNDVVQKKEFTKIIEKYLDILEEIYEITEKYNRSNINIDEYRKILNTKLNKINQLIAYGNEKERESIEFKLLLTAVKKAISILENNYGIKSYNNTARILTSTLLLFKNAKSINRPEIIEMQQDIVNILKNKNFKYNYIALKLLEIIEENIEVDFGINGEMYLTLFVYTLTKKSSINYINGIIVAHGDSTASSIASVVNKLLGEFIFEPFDMPIDMKPEEIIVTIKNYIKNFSKSKGTIFLVDMGSLFEIYSSIKDTMDNEVAVINNITTQLALGVGDMILKEKSIKEIIDNVIRDTKMSYKYFESKEKKKAIVTCCATGIGVASKIKEIIKGCIDDENIEVLAYDYFKLKSNRLNDEIFNDYEVELIVSTLELNIKGIDVILLSDCFKKEGEAKLRKAFSKIVKNRSADILIKDLIKLLSLQNIISRMIILNPERVINDVERIINILENELEIKLNSDLRLTLFIHTAIMIERVVLNRDTNLEDEDEIPIKYDTKDLEMVQKILDNELKDYSIKVPAYETAVILGIIKNRI